ncbi:MAG: hypothetical protein LBV07_02465, partial [Syntrophobacterales bacterium]|nr:hypothetical protein [Syntrophobacterales bacterium]
NVPYEISMSLYASKDNYRGRKYSSSFCLAYDEDGELVITGTVYDKEKYMSRCLKPGEKPPPKSTFWQRLFGE